MKKLSFAIVAFLGLGLGFTANAQDDNDDTHLVTIVINEHSIIDIEPNGSKNITQTFVAPTEAGNGLTTPAANASLWLNYSSIISTGETRTISVKASVLVPGVAISVLAAAPVVAGGNGGTGSTVVLTAADQPIITGIGSVYTGDGASAGSNVTYTLSNPVANYGSIVAGSTDVTVTYTISNN
jgi:hypothetical protein